MSVHFKRASHSGFTIIEVVLVLAVSGFLLMIVLGSASVGVNTQRYRDSVNTLAAIVQQEFTNTTNPMNTKSVDEMCEGTTDANSHEVPLIA
jgi:prepilin-type N-terminal cleavage/methylation domain-containing protein